MQVPQAAEPRQSGTEVMQEEVPEAPEDRQTQELIEQ